MSRLPEACLDEALAIIDERGLEHLSLREVARRLGVSHQAPYRHFPSRDHLLAAAVARSYAALADALDAREASPDPRADLRAMGVAYLGHALVHPLHYRLMFATALPDPDQHPAMLARARHTFDLLRGCLRRLGQAAGVELPRASLDADALFVWSTMHGLAGTLRGDAIATLDVAPAVLAGMVDRVLDGIGAALAASMTAAMAASMAAVTDPLADTPTGRDGDAGPRDA